MSTLLLTGASGFLGSALLAELTQKHNVITLGRHRLPDTEHHKSYTGLFSEFEDLRQLDACQIDVVIHLAAVTGGCLEREGLLVNAEGTRSLMRYLIDRGCRKFVLASSTAVVGFEDPNFIPQQIPIPDEYPCWDHDGYGLSKYLMEEIARYYVRQNSEIDVIALRFAALGPDDAMPPKVTVGPTYPWALGSITMMQRFQAIRALCLAVEAPLKPGIRIMNAVSRKAWTAEPVATVLRNWWGNSVDLSYFDVPGQEHNSIFACDRIRNELGFVAD